MPESATVILKNNSGRSLDNVAIWHTSAAPSVPDLTQSPVIEARNLANGAQVKGTVPLTWGSPSDYWAGGVLFQGDGTKYVITGNLGDAYKEYEVSDGSTITFIIEKYTTGTTNQSEITIQYSGDNGGSAYLLNPEVQKWVGLASDLAQEIFEQMLEDAA